MSRIVVIDLLFNWPPDGGARVDLKEVMSRLSQSHSVTLLVPDFQDYFPRGRIIGDFPFEIIKLHFTKATFNALNLPRVFRKAIQKIKPHKLFIADGWYLKFPLAAALKEYRPILRFYAYEGLCIKDYGTQFRDGKICPKNYLRDTRECTLCAMKNHRFRPLNMFSHEFLASLAFTPLYRRWVERAIRSASTLVVYNRFMQETLSPYHRDVRVIPSGVDVAALQNVPGHRPGGVPTILMTSRMGDEGKGFYVLREAVRILTQKGLNFKVIIPTYSRSEPVDDAIEYLPWHSQEELPALYAMADICVVPSVWREPFGIAAVEAMAAGKPVVASRVGGLEDIIEDGVTGFLVEPGNVRALTERLITLIDDASLRTRMGDAAKQKARCHYDWGRIITMYDFLTESRM
ncbi:MAG: glycosyltransferase family 4 protein [Candidatus Aureabacteria bacterium]|nr:glycosyltransferase family 4 protein [Candidatus Auribacterota bacterium]